MNNIRKQIGCLVKGNIPGPVITCSQWAEEDKDTIWLKFLKFFSFKDTIWLKFLKFFSFLDLDRARTCFDAYLNLNYSKWLCKARNEAKAKAGVDDCDDSCKAYEPRYLSIETWAAMMDEFLKPEWMAKSKKASENRKRKLNYMPYTGGSSSFDACTDNLSQKLSRNACLPKALLETHKPLNDRGNACLLIMKD